MNKLDKIVANARNDAEIRSKGYRDRALKMYPHICTKCTREFSSKNLRELTVHHKNHDHDDNPADGSNWELLCIYCHDNEHSRYIDAEWTAGAQDEKKGEELSHNPFGALASLMGKK